MASDDEGFLELSDKCGEEMFFFRMTSFRAGWGGWVEGALAVWDWDLMRCGLFSEESRLGLLGMEGLLYTGGGAGPEDTPGDLIGPSFRSTLTALIGFFKGGTTFPFADSAIISTL